MRGTYLYLELVPLLNDDVAGVQLLPLALVALGGQQASAGGGTYCIFLAVVFVPHSPSGSFRLDLCYGAPSDPLIM